MGSIENGENKASKILGRGIQVEQVIKYTLVVSTLKPIQPIKSLSLQNKACQSII